MQIIVHNEGVRQALECSEFMWHKIIWAFYAHTILCHDIMFMQHKHNFMQHKKGHLCVINIKKHLRGNPVIAYALIDFLMYPFLIYSIAFHSVVQSYY